MLNTNMDLAASPMSPRADTVAPPMNPPMGPADPIDGPGCTSDETSDGTGCTDDTATGQVGQMFHALQTARRDGRKPVPGVGGDGKLSEPTHRLMPPSDG
jgi:hypothetical protein